MTRSVRRSVGCLVDWYVGRLVSCLVGWLGGWIVGWLVGHNFFKILSVIVSGSYT